MIFLIIYDDYQVDRESELRLKNIYYESINWQLASDGRTFFKCL